METYSTYTDLTDITDIYDDQDTSAASCCCGPAAPEVEYVEPTWGGEAQYGYAQDSSVWLDPEPEVLAPAATYVAPVPTEAAAVIPAGQPGSDLDWQSQSTHDGLYPTVATIGVLEPAAVAAVPSAGYFDGGGFSALASTPAPSDSFGSLWTGDGFSALATTAAADPTWAAAVATGGPTFPPTEMYISSTPNALGQIAAHGDIGTQIAIAGIRESQDWTNRLWTL